MSRTGKVLEDGVAFTQMRGKMILREYVWVVSPPIMGNESLLTNTERAPGTRYAAHLRDYRGLSP